MKNNRYRKLDKCFCYLDDVLGEPFDPETFCHNAGAGFWSINGKQYLDPDAVSKRLYEELFLVYSEKGQYGRTGMFLSWKHMTLSSDFIGPSVAGAIKAGFSEFICFNYLTMFVDEETSLPYDLKSFHGNGFNQLVRALPEKSAILDVDEYRKFIAASVWLIKKRSDLISISC